MPRAAGRGKIVRKTLKMHITHHFMPLGVPLVSFILTTIHVSFKKCQWNSSRLCGTVFCSHCSAKKVFNCKICKVNRILCVKNVVCGMCIHTSMDSCCHCSSLNAFCIKRALLDCAVLPVLEAPKCDQLR